MFDTVYMRDIPACLLLRCCNLNAILRTDFFEVGVQLWCQLCHLRQPKGKNIRMRKNWTDKTFFSFFSIVFAFNYYCYYHFTSAPCTDVTPSKFFPRNANIEWANTVVKDMQKNRKFSLFITQNGKNNACFNEYDSFFIIYMHGKAYRRLVSPWSGIKCMNFFTFCCISQSGSKQSSKIWWALPGMCTCLYVLFGCPADF